MQPWHYQFISHMMSLILYALAAYLIGAIPFGWLIGRMKGVDVLKEGSGSSGATNVGRSVGKFWFAVTFLLDAAKGTAVILLANYFGQQDYALVLGFLAVLGHCYSPFLGFHGGKGVSTLLGVSLLGFNPEVWIPALVLWIFLAVQVRKISIASLAAMVMVVIMIWFGGKTVLEDRFVGTALVLLIIWQHRDNIKRLVAGKEQKLHMK